MERPFTFWTLDFQFLRDINGADLLQHRIRTAPGAPASRRLALKRQCWQEHQTKEKRTHGIFANRWRGGAVTAGGRCAASDMPAVAVASLDWFAASFPLQGAVWCPPRRTAILRRT